MSPAQRDLLNLVEAVKASSKVTESATLTQAQNAYLLTLGSALAHQIAAATYTAECMGRYAKQCKEGE